MAISKQGSLLDLVGLLTPKEAEEMKKYIKESRERMKREMEERFKTWDKI